MKSKNFEYLPALTHLRALAALLVMLFHGRTVIAPAATGPSPNPLWNVIIEGHTGVSLFLILSGFVFEHGTLGRAIRYWPFLRNRFLRIYPLFIFVLVVGAYAEPDRFTFLGFVQSLFLMGNLPGAIVINNPFSGTVWTLTVECQFYLLFPFLHRMAHEKGVKWLGGVLALFVVTRAAAVFAGGTNARDLSYWTIVGRMDQFLIGMMLAHVLAAFRRSGSRFPLGALFPISAALVVALATGLERMGGWDDAGRWKIAWLDLEGVVWAGFLLTYLHVARFLPRAVDRVLSLLGEVSYSTYLLHFLFATTFASYGSYPTFSANPSWNALWGTLLMIVPATLAMSALTYTFVERPFLGLRGQYLGEPFPAPAPATNGPRVAA